MRAAAKASRSEDHSGANTSLDHRATMRRPSTSNHPLSQPRSADLESLVGPARTCPREDQTVEFTREHEPPGKGIAAAARSGSGKLHCHAGSCVIEGPIPSGPRGDGSRAPVPPRDIRVGPRGRARFAPPNARGTAASANPGTSEVQALSSRAARLASRTSAVRTPGATEASSWGSTSWRSTLRAKRRSSFEESSRGVRPAEVT